MRNRLKVQRDLKQADNVRAILVDPHAVVLSDHVRAGVAHLLRDPVYRSHACGKQLAGVGVGTGQDRDNERPPLSSAL